MVIVILYSCHKTLRFLVVQSESPCPCRRKEYFYSSKNHTPQCLEEQVDDPEAVPTRHIDGRDIVCCPNLARLGLSGSEYPEKEKKLDKLS